MLSDLAKFLRYSTALPGFLRRSVSRQEAKSRLREALACRDSRFLRIVERAVFANPGSPYLELLRWAGIGFADLEGLVRQEGLEPALSRLHDDGVFLSIDELKGRRPIERPGLHVPTSPSSFDNPLLTQHWEAKSSGSTGARTRANIDLALIEHEAAYVSLYLDAFDLWQRPYGTWRPVPPAVAAVKWMLRLEHLGKPLDRWFAHDRHRLGNGEWKYALFTATTLAGGRLFGRRLPAPRHVPADAPAPIVDWLAEARRAGAPAVLDTMVSSAVRVCGEARERGIDISGTLFRVGGEPLTPAKIGLIEEIGCRVLTFYSSTETSFLGAPCADSDAADDVHLLTDKIAVITRPKTLGEQVVDGLVFTTLLPSAPKLMINVEYGDCGELDERSCRCPLGELGFRRHLRSIRSYDKLTSEGVSFLGTELLRLLDEVLPRRFGGAPIDWQLVEEEVAGRTRVAVVASPEIGELDEATVKEAILDELRAYPGGDSMTRTWRQGDTLRLVRRRPYRTESSKILPLVRHRGDG